MTWLPLLIALYSLACSTGPVEPPAAEVDAAGEPSQATAQDVAHSEEAVRAFLASDYMDPDNTDTVTASFTPELAALWIRASTHDADGMRYWDADPILETQDMAPKQLLLGPARVDGSQILCPVVYQPIVQRTPQGAAPYTELDGAAFTKTFVFARHGDRWLIADITTAGLQRETVSQLGQLKADLGG